MKLNIWRELGGRPQEYPSHQMGRLLDGRTLAQPQRRGRMTVIPLLGSAVEEGLFGTPETALSLDKVHTYGVMELKNSSPKPAIVPLHLGYFQQGAQNHAMCQSAILKPGETRVFKDACCIQASQGGYIRDHSARFIVLPHDLRQTAFEKRGVESYSKLWETISRFNLTLGLKNRGHLDELKQQFQPEMVQATYQFERVEGQTGAIFLIDGKIVGIELSPDPAFYAEMHNPLVMYGYTPLRIRQDRAEADYPAGIQLNTDGLTSGEELLARLEALESARMRYAQQLIDRWSEMEVSYTRDESVAGHTLWTVNGQEFSGQAVFHRGRPAYASLFHATEFRIR